MMGETQIEPVECEIGKIKWKTVPDFKLRSTGFFHVVVQDSP